MQFFLVNGCHGVLTCTGVSDGNLGNEGVEGVEGVEGMPFNRLESSRNTRMNAK